MKEIYRWDKFLQTRHGIESCTYALFLLLLICVVPTNMLAAMDSAKISEPALQQSYTWFDGPIERKVWLNPHLVAEFSPRPEEQSPVKLTYGNDAVTRPESVSAVRFWQLDGITPESALSSISASYPTSKLSPVFHITASTGSPKYALPGNIIVVFRSSWDSSQIEKWLQSKGLEVVKKMEGIPTLYVLKTGPGFEALETANAIYQSGEVENCMPNWWYEITLR